MAEALVLAHTRDQAEQAKERLARWLAPRGLAFNEDKTRVTTQRRRRTRPLSWTPPPGSCYAAKTAAAYGAKGCCCTPTASRKPRATRHAAD